MADTDLRGTVLDGRYQVIEPIAEGAMGSVYRGERMGLGRAVAIKVMHQELPDELASRQRFEREAKLMALLEHPNCVSVMDFGVHEDKPFLVRDLVRGTSLIQLLDEVGKLEPARACDIIRQVLAGLAHAHELGIVHRDIKPANIMISEKAGLGQQVRILDFGLARLQEATGTKLTTGIVVGTPNYMAPEQCKGGDIDARTDLYAVGVMLFEMLTGRKPFVANDPIQVVRKHLTERPPTLASVLPNTDFGELEAVVAKALAKVPADRFANAVEMAQAIDAAAGKAAKMSAAALFSRAVPEGAPAAGNQQATMSGWSVPSAAGGAAAPATVPHAPSGPVPPNTAPMSAPPGPAPHVPSAPTSVPPGHVPHAPPPTTAPMPSPTTESGTQILSDSAILPESATMPPAHATTIEPSPFSGADTVRDSAPPGQGGLPPLPQAGPYVPPPSFSTGPAPVVRSGTTGPAAVVPSATTGPAPLVPSSGAPDQSLGIPPTRPTTSAAGTQPTRAPKIQLSKKQLMIAGGGVVAVIVVIAIVASGGGKSSATSTKTGSGSTTVEEPPSDPVPQVVERANALIESEDYEDAVAVLKRARKANPDNAELAFLSGKANFGRLWWTDGVADFRDAIRLDDSYKENTDLLKTVLKGFITTPDVDDRIVGFMREVGPPFRPLLEETAEKHPKKAIRARARAELNARP